jgi:outer membrane protein assembly factor BamB
LLTAAGILAAMSADGKLLWQHSMMEEYGRLTFPNGRTGAPVIDDTIVIVRGITSNWGTQGAAADRFYAFDKTTGQIVWASTPGDVPPKDSSFSTPVLAWHDGRRVFYCGTGDGSVVCVNARTGEPLWRYKISAGGINSSVVLFKNLVIAGHADENLDASETGRTVAVNTDVVAARAEGGSSLPRPASATPGPVVLDRNAEAWRNKEILLTSSPVVAGDRIYLVNKVGELCNIDGATGKVSWRHKLGSDQLHASPLYADGKLYIPMRDAGLFIVRPGESGAEVLSHTALEGEALGAPAVYKGKIFLHTTRKLYCFGAVTARAESGSDNNSSANRVQRARLQTEENIPTPGPVTQVQVVPCEVLLRPGQKQSFVLRGLDANGLLVKELKGGQWKKFIPPTAKVKSEMDADFNENGGLAAKDNARQSAGAWEVTVDGFKGYIRGRVVAGAPYREDFESFQPVAQPDGEPGAIFAWPPLPWIGARFKWDIRDHEGSKVLVKTLDRILFQRAFTFIGDSSLKNYTIEADVMSEGNRRNMSNVGVINQHYIINLVGNWQQLEVLSNQDRVKMSVPFSWQPKVWYHIKSRVDVKTDGSGVVRAKAWKRGEPEPEKWTIEVPHKHAHEQGAPGVYGFALQSQFRVYVDNISVKQNE